MTEMKMIADVSLLTKMDLVSVNLKTSSTLIEHQGWPVDTDSPLVFL